MHLHQLFISGLTYLSARAVAELLIAECVMVPGLDGDAQASYYSDAISIHSDAAGPDLPLDLHGPDRCLPFSSLRCMFAGPISFGCGLRMGCCANHLSLRTGLLWDRYHWSGVGRPPRRGDERSSPRRETPFHNILQLPHRSCQYVAAASIQ